MLTDKYNYYYLISGNGKTKYILSESTHYLPLWQDPSSHSSLYDLPQTQLPSSSPIPSASPSLPT